MYYLCVCTSPSLYHYQGSVPELCQRARFMEECNAHLPICRVKICFEMYCGSGMSGLRSKNFAGNVA